MSAANSGGVSSNTFFTHCTIRSTGSCNASQVSFTTIFIVFGNPVNKSRPRISNSPLLTSRIAAPIFIFASSAVRSPIIMLYSFFTYLTIASSNLSPPIRKDSLITMPPKLITATSVVPPPISTTIDPYGSEISSPAPKAAANGSSIK